LILINSGAFLGPIFASRQTMTHPPTPPPAAQSVRRSVSRSASRPVPNIALSADAQASAVVTNRVTVNAIRCDP